MVKKADEKIIYIRDEDILERPRICMYQKNPNSWYMGVLIRIRSGLNFIYEIRPYTISHFGEYIDEATKEFERQVLRLKRFESADMDMIFRKVNPDDYGKEKKYFVYPQPDKWLFHPANGEPTVYPKRNEAEPWKDQTAEDLMETARSLHYKSIEEWWEEEEKYHYFSHADAELMKTDVERPEHEPGYSLLEPTLYDLTGVMDTETT